MEDDQLYSFSAFISHSSKDDEKADMICQSLEAKGLKCWIDHRNVRPGREWGDEIIFGIENSRCLILLLSAEANQSTYVRREVERAVSKKKPVFPVRMEDIMPSPSLELFVSSTHWLDAHSGSLTEHADHLVHELQTLISGKTAPPFPQAPAGRKKGKKPPILPISGAVLAIGLLSIVGISFFGEDNQEPFPPEGEPAKTRPTSPGAESQTSPAEGPGLPLSQGDRPTEIPSSTTPTPVVMTDEQSLQMMELSAGLNLDQLTREDFQVSIVPDRTIQNRLTVEIEMEDELQRFLKGIARVDLSIDGVAQPRTQFDGTNQVFGGKLDQNRLKEAESITLELEFMGVKTVGPFTYAVEANTAEYSNIRQSLNQSNLSSMTWLDDTFSINLGPFFPYVERVSIGYSKDNLDRSFQVRGLEGHTQRAASISSAYATYLRAIPVLPERDIYVQIELKDGSTTPVFVERHKPPSNADDARTPIELQSVGQNPEDGAPSLYLWEEDGSYTCVLNEWFKDNERVTYSFDPNPGFDADNLNTHGLGIGFSFRFQAPLTATEFFVEVERDGKIDQYRYELQADQGESLLADSVSKAFQMINDPLEAVRVLREIEGNRRFTRLVRNGTDITYGWINVPGLAIQPGVAVRYGKGDQWIGVRSIRYGPSGRDLPYEFTIPYTLSDYSQGKKFNDATGQERSTFDILFQIVLPRDTPAFFYQFVYRNGEESRVIRLPLPK